MNVPWRVHFPKCKLGEVYVVVVSIVILVVLVASPKTNQISIMSCNLLPQPTKKWPSQRPSYYDQMNRVLFQQQNVSWQRLEIIELLIVEAIQDTIEQGKQFVVKRNILSNFIIVNIKVFLHLYSNLQHNNQFGVNTSKQIKFTQFPSFGNCQIMRVESKENKGNDVWPKGMASIMVNGTKALSHTFCT